MKSGWQDKLRVFWRGWVLPLLSVAIVMTSFRSAVADWNDVPSGSMKPSIQEGDRIFVNKLAYDLRLPFTNVRIAAWDKPRRGDVVVLFSPADGRRLVKRVIGLPGDAIQMRSNRITINGHAASYQPSGSELDSKTEGWIFDEEFGAHRNPVTISPWIRSMASFGPVTVPEGQYFVMGDNRGHSFDSRFFGCVERSLIVGQANMVVMSLDPSNHYLPRWERFLKELP